MKSIVIEQAAPTLDTPTHFGLIIVYNKHGKGNLKEKNEYVLNDLKIKLKMGST